MSKSRLAIDLLGCVIGIGILSAGIVILHPTVAHAGERIILSFGQYTIYHSGISDQLPVQVKLNHLGGDTVNLIYTAYDNNNILLLSYNHQIQMSDGQGFTDNITVPAGTVPVRFYAEAQGINGGADVMQTTQINNFTL
jgi:hypothetical protein